MPRRAFSLIEVLIVVVIVLAIAAVVFADLSGWSAQARFEAAGRRVEAAAGLARADAMREGRALSLVAVERAGGTTLELEPFEAGASSERPGDADEAESVRPRARKLLELPDGVRVTSSPPRARADGAPPAPQDRPTSERDARGMQGERDQGPVLGSGRVTVCVLLPDGSAWGESARYLVGPGERLAEVRVGSWTGSARVVELAWPSEETGTGSEDLEVPPGQGGTKP